MVAPVEPALAIACERPRRRPERQGRPRPPASSAPRRRAPRRRLSPRPPAPAPRRLSPPPRPGRPRRRRRAAGSRRPPRLGRRRRCLGPSLGAATVEGDRRSTAYSSASAGLRGGLGDLVLDHLTPRIGPAHRADPMRQARTVAARALVQARRARLVGGAALVAPCARGPFLGTAMRSEDGSGGGQRGP